MTTHIPEPNPPSSLLDLPSIKTGKKLTGAEREDFAKKVALVQCRAEPRPRLDLFLHCQVPTVPVPAGPTAVRP